MDPLKFVVISDTHGMHDLLQLPEGDVLIHAGDVSKYGTEAEIQEFLQWFAVQKFKHKIFIAGNHDFFFENKSSSFLSEFIPEGVTYLKDSSIEIEGIKIWGSPVQPQYYNMAFNKERGEDIRKHWSLIPNDLDILITHGPPFGILDQNCQNECCGCIDLLEKIDEVKPKYFVFGHIHESAGMSNRGDIVLINACLLDEKYKLINKPVTFLYQK